MTETYVNINDAGAIANPGAVRTFFKQLEPGRYRLRAVATRKRSLPQNAYFHGPMLMAIMHGLQDAGWDWVTTPEHAKDVVKNKFLKSWTPGKDGLAIERIKRTSELSKEEMAIFIDKCIFWAFDFLGITIPPPNKQLDAFEQAQYA